ncbi:hypothetical protein LIG30_4936, partial [Burkholderia sp. lig30]
MRSQLVYEGNAIGSIGSSYPQAAAVSNFGTSGNRLWPSLKQPRAPEGAGEGAGE